MPQLVRDVMSRRVLYVTPTASIRTAMELLRSQQLEALPVMAGGRLVGMVDTLDLFRFNGEFPVSEAVSPGRASVTVSPDDPVIEGARRMIQHSLRQLPVVRDGQLVGLLSDRDLAASWGNAPDALTGLPWQDEMRRWATRHLASGREITILFVDLNNFGAINKQRGHVYGDRVLQQVAGALREVVDSERDFRCRYGGDEFVIASLRPLDSARCLAVAVRDAVCRLEVDGERGAIQVAIGVAGGQRHVPRPGTHPSATLDDLLNLASQASTRAKRSPEQLEVVESPRGDAMERSLVPLTMSPPAETSERVVVDRYTVERRAREVAVSVVLRSEGIEREATQVRPPEEAELALAAATADCLASLTPPQLQLRVEAMRRLSIDGDDGLIMAVLAWREPEGEEERLVGASLIRGDAFRAVINAVLDATNRRISRWLIRPAPRRSQSRRREG